VLQEHSKRGAIAILLRIEFRRLLCGRQRPVPVPALSKQAPDGVVLERVGQHRLCGRIPGFQLHRPGSRLPRFQPEASAKIRLRQPHLMHGNLRLGRRQATELDDRFLDLARLQQREPGVFERDQLNGAGEMLAQGRAERLDVCRGPHPGAGMQTDDALHVPPSRRHLEVHRDSRRAKLHILAFGRLRGAERVGNVDQVTQLVDERIRQDQGALATLPLRFL
jgi:hypothetical protein